MALNSPSKSGVHPSTSPVKPHLFALGSSHGPPASPMQGTPGRKGGHFSRRGAALDAGERLPPSPSDPQLGMDLRKTALLRSLLLRTEVRPRSLCACQTCSMSRLGSTHTVTKLMNFAAVAGSHGTFAPTCPGESLANMVFLLWATWWGVYSHSGKRGSVGRARYATLQGG